MTIPPWADLQLSEELHRLVLVGESHALEFKRELPKQLRDLAKEIAAFASSGGGRLLLGVADDGSIPGLNGADQAAARDDFGQRVVGICQMVEPPVRPRLAWACAGSAAVLVITVDKGTEPLYYVESRPYLRHDTVCRPATPDEVRAAMSAAAPVNAPKKTMTHPELSKLAQLLANVLRWCDTDSEMRSLKPWVDEWMYDAARYAVDVRDLGVSDWAGTSDMGARLDALADHLDEVAHFRHYLGSGRDFDEVCDAARGGAAELMRDVVDPVAVDEASQREVLQTIGRLAREQKQRWSRAAKDLFDGRVEKAQADSYTAGQQIATWTYFKLSLLPADALTDLRRIGFGLLKLASMRVYFDGGASQQRIVDEALVLVDALVAHAAAFPEPARQVV